jgi:hypothetical protein
MKTNIKRRIEGLERGLRSRRPRHSVQFDKDALAIYTGIAYLDATVDPDYHEVEPTAVYARGQVLRDALYGPIVPAYLDPHIKRYTRASGEFELAFGREPKAGEILCDQHVILRHNPEVYAKHFGKLNEAWRRQLPHLSCPLKFEEGRLLRRLKPTRRGEQGEWEEDYKIQPLERWLTIPEVLSNTDFEAGLTISAVVFVGVVGAKHQCRPATREDLKSVETESPLQAPPFFKYGWQRFCDLLVEVMGA